MTDNDDSYKKPEDTQEAEDEYTHCCCCFPKNCGLFFICLFASAGLCLEMYFTYLTVGSGDGLGFFYMGIAAGYIFACAWNISLFFRWIFFGMGEHRESDDNDDQEFEVHTGEIREGETEKKKRSGTELRVDSLEDGLFTYVQMTLVQIVVCFIIIWQRDTYEALLI